MTEAAPTTGAGAPAPGRRLQQLADLPVTVLRGVGQAVARDLGELGIATVFDLVTHYPRRYIDGTRMLTVDRLAEGEKATVLATVRRVSAPPVRTGPAGVSESRTARVTSPGTTLRAVVSMASALAAPPASGS